MFDITNILAFITTPGVIIIFYANSYLDPSDHLLDIITLCILMDSSLWSDTINLGKLHCTNLEVWGYKFCLFDLILYVPSTIF